MASMRNCVSLSIKINKIARFGVSFKRKLSNIKKITHLNSNTDYLRESLKNDKYFNVELESRIYKWWEDSGYFAPKSTSGDEEDPFVIPMPPPNVTGYLHMGHAIFVALQDIMVLNKYLFYKDSH